MSFFFFLCVSSILFGGIVSWGAIQFFENRAEKEISRKLASFLDKQYPYTVYPRYQEYWHTERHDYITDIIRGSYIYTDDKHKGITHYYKAGDRYIDGRTFLLLHLLHKMGIRVKPRC